MEILRFVTHYGMHFFVPSLIAYIFFKNQWKKVWIIFVLTMLIDLDHLFASPIFDATRCSINYHPLHTYFAGVLYALFLFVPKLRIIGIGLLFHLLTDFTDCFWLK